jgi:hypothetical protein
MSIAVVGCHYDKSKLAGQFIKKKRLGKALRPQLQ